MKVSKIITILLLFSLSILLAFILPPHELLSQAGRVTTFIFLLAAFLWTFEVIPAFATGILVIALNVTLLGMPGGVFAVTKTDWKMFIAPISSPIILIFFGGFVMSHVIQKYGLDQRISQLVIGRVSHSPSLLLAMLMLCTALLSMFMSNTATTAMMFAIFGKPIHHLPSEEKKYKMALILSIPFSANIGGIATLIGSPPNGIAKGILASSHVIDLDFMDWFKIGFPLSFFLLILTWIYLWTFFKPRGKVQFKMELGKVQSSFLHHTIIASVFLTTIFLWLSGSLTGLPAAVVALFPVCVFTVLGYFEGRDFRAINWDVIVLVAGGMSLGLAIQKTGLGLYLMELLPLSDEHEWLLVPFLLLLILCLSNFISNSAAAAMLIPLVIQLDGNQIRNSILVAMGASLAMSLPISTPPNAIAFSSGKVPLRHFMISGTLISLLGILFLLVAVFLGKKFGLPAFV